MARTAGFTFLHLTHCHMLVFFFRDIEYIMAVCAFKADTPDMAVMAENDIAFFFYFKGDLTPAHFS